jgi:homoserine dehydrogenase
VRTRGIESLTQEDAVFAENFGAKLKLIASASREPDSDKIFISVEPHLVCNGNPLSHVSDVFNAVAADCSSAGRLMFYGRGAGKLPTASAVLSDITAALAANGTIDNDVWEDCNETIIIDSKTVKRGFYLKLKNADGQVLYGNSEEEITAKYGAEEIESLIPILE